MLLEQNYVHLPLKVAMHAVNPVQRLRLLRTQLTRQTAQSMGPEWLFHREMASIFMSVRDLHTNYLLPKPFAGKVAYLPFVLEKATEADGDHYLVTSIVTGFSGARFRARSRGHPLERRAHRHRGGDQRASGWPAATGPPASPGDSTR